MNLTSFLTYLVVTTFLFGCLLPSATAFTPSSLKSLKYPPVQTQKSSGIPTELFERISNKRREQLGIGEGEDEYDLGKALERNTDPLISKIIAGSFILVMIALLVVGVVIPYTADYGEGVCNPIANGGRC